MPEPLSNQSGAEQELPQYIECLLSVSGDAAFLNTFDKAFRSGCGPQWADRPPNTKPRYSFHALFPVPEEIQRRGFLKAGRLWCAGYWEAGGDLCETGIGRTALPFLRMGHAPQKYVSRCLPALSNPEVLLDRAYQGRQFRTMGQRIDPARVHDRKWAVHGKLPPE